MSAAIALTRGYVAIVDDDDAELVNAIKWHAVVKENGSVYARCFRAGEYVLMHRMIMNAPADVEVDHLDGDGLNNRRRSNLRLATRLQNSRNRKQRKPRSHPKGVQQISPTSFQAKIGFGGKKIHLGCFTTANEAGLAYDQAAKQIFGEFASLNFPGDACR